MDVERYAAQVLRVQSEVAAERARLDTLRADVADEQARGSHADRLAEVIANGYALLDTPDTAAANAWLRQRVRVWVEDNMIVEVEWL